MSKQQKHIVVIGAGVTGLSNAKFLAETGYLVTVVAEHVPGDSSIEYTSPWAGAHWCTHATVNEPLQCDWDVQTYKYWLDLLEQEVKGTAVGPRVGRSLKVQNAHIYWTDQDPERLWWAPHVRNFKQLPFHKGTTVDEINSRTPAGTSKIRWAIQYDEIAIDAPGYLRWLSAQCEFLGVKIIRAKLPTDQGLAAALTFAQRIATEQGRRPRADGFVNATGIGAYALCGDTKVYPVRGQTVLVKGEAATNYIRRGTGPTVYCVTRPGSGTTILGGTREKGNWSETPDPETTRRILDQSSWVVRDLLTAANGGFEVISAQCGLRPGREGGPRMEVEVLDEGKMKVVHSYGHEGAGYQNSVGSARLVVRLVGEMFEEQNAAGL